MFGDPRDVQAVIRGAKTVSDKIRALDRAGYGRSEIARFLGKRYQHVCNVLEADEQVGTCGSFREAPPEANEAGSSGSAKVRVGRKGEVVIPAPMREALGIAEGATLFARVDDGEVRLLTARAAARRARAEIRSFVPEDVSLADELIEDRRREVARETDHD